MKIYYHPDMCHVPIYRLLTKITLASVISAADNSRSNDTHSHSHTESGPIPSWSAVQWPIQTMCRNYMDRFLQKPKYTFSLSYSGQDNKLITQENLLRSWYIYYTSHFWTNRRCKYMFHIYVLVVGDKLIVIRSVIPGGTKEVRGRSGRNVQMTSRIWFPLTLDIGERKRDREHLQL